MPICAVISRFLLATCVATSLAGCKSDLADPAADAGSPVLDDWPTRCDFPSVNIPAGSDAITAACFRLYHAAGVFNRVCSFPGALDSQRSFVDSCVALFHTNGARLAPADIDACAAATCELQCRDVLLQGSCLGAGGQLLFPLHDHKGSLPPGAPCIAGIQCDSGFCSACANASCYPGPGCGVCQRVLALGDACGARPAESPDVNLCLGADCIQGTCALKGKPDGTLCQWYYGTEGCQHRCLQPGFQSPGHCAPLGAVGDWCGGANNSPECLPGLLCDRDACAMPLPDGAACDINAPPCVHACVAGTCRRLRFGLGVGEDCAYDECEPRLSCVAGRCAVHSPPADLGAGDLTVAPLPKGAKCDFGQACSAGQFCWASCNDPGCLSDKTACVDIPAIGAPCTFFGGCGPGAWCYQPEVGPRVCVIPSDEGGPCPCRSSVVCHRGQCIAWGPELCQ